MNRADRYLFTATGLLLGLLLALSSVNAAVMRAGMSLSASVILCTSAGAVDVALGPDGQPEENAHHCPDCTLVAADLHRAPGPLPRGETLISLRPTVPARLALQHKVQGGAGRGPPVLI